MGCRWAAFLEGRSQPPVRSRRACRSSLRPVGPATTEAFHSGEECECESQEKTARGTHKTDLETFRTGRHRGEAGRINEPDLLSSLLFFQVGCQLRLLFFFLQFRILLPQYFGITKDPGLLLFPDGRLIQTILVLRNGPLQPLFVASEILDLQLVGFEVAFELGNGGISGTLNSSVSDNGTFAINRSDTYSYGYAITGTGGFCWKCGVVPPRRRQRKNGNPEIWRRRN